MESIPEFQMTSLPGLYVGAYLEREQSSSYSVKNSTLCVEDGAWGDWVLT